MRITSITPMKDEGPFVLEWVAYHQLIGFNDMIVFTNDCSDGTDDLLERLDELGYLRHLPNPSFLNDSRSHHWQVLGYADKMKRVRKSDWFLSFDVDEFVCINVGEGNLSDLFGAFPDADAISMNQLRFGCSGIRKFSPDLMINQFTACDYLKAGRKGDEARGIKTLHKNKYPFQTFSNHSSIYSERHVKEMHWINGGGTALPDAVKKKPNLKYLGADLVDHSAVQVNHYAVRSMESFLAQVARGDANFEDALPRDRYWKRNNKNHESNSSIQRHSDRVAERMDQMLLDPELRDLHQTCIARHQAMIAQVSELEGFKMLLQSIEEEHSNRWENSDNREIEH